jgi:AraC family transcriptional regulator
MPQPRDRRPAHAAAVVGADALRGLPSVVTRETTALGPLVTLREVEDPARADFVLPPSESLAVVVVTGGDYVLETGRPLSGRHAHMRPGSSSVTAPRREVEGRWSSTATTSYTSRHLHVHESYLERVCDELGAGERRPDYLHRDDAFVTASLNELAASERRRAPRLHLESVLHALVGHLALQGEEPPAAPTGVLDARALAAVVDYMHAHLDQQVTLDDLAGAAHLSRYHFLRRFTATQQVTPMRYLTTLRMARAEELLREDRLSVGAVAAACGYGSASAFAAAYRRATGSSPTAARGAATR